MEAAKNPLMPDYQSVSSPGFCFVNTGQAGWMMAGFPPRQENVRCCKIPWLEVP